MSTRSTTVIATLGVVILGATGVLVWWLWPEPVQEVAQTQAPIREHSELLHPQRPTEPPVPGRDRREPAAEPVAPDELKAIKAKAYAQAVEAGYERPGEVAFRAMIDAFMQYNQAFAEAQAREEGLSVDEVQELTYFGFVALESQRWPDVQELVGRELSEDERTGAEALMHATNAEFKTKIREAVDAGASQEERWELIQATQEAYFEQYYELTGMNPALLDELLAGDPSRIFAPADTPPPESIEPAEAPPAIEPRPSH